MGSTVGDGGREVPDTAPQSLEVTLGKRVRELRRRQDMSGVDLARAAGVSVATISKVETGSISTSLGTLEALARSLNVPIAELFLGVEDRRDCTLVKAGEGLRIDRRGTRAGHHYALLGHALRGPIVVEPFLITLAPDAEPYSQFRHAGIEFIYMLEGEIVYRHGDNTHALAPGDAMMFDAGALHGPASLGALPARFLSVIIYPREDV